MHAYTHHHWLHDTDVMSIARSLEVLVPFFDHRLVEMVLWLPTVIKTSGHGTKPFCLRRWANFYRMWCGTGPVSKALLPLLLSGCAARLYPVMACCRAARTHAAPS